MHKCISLSVLALGLLCGNLAFAGPTGIPHKDNPSFGRPWLQGYSGGMNSTQYRVVRPRVQTSPVYTGRVTLGPYFRANDGPFRITEAYRASTKSVTRERAELAGERLANALHQRCSTRQPHVSFWNDVCFWNDVLEGLASAVYYGLMLVLAAMLHLRDEE